MDSFLLKLAICFLFLDVSAAFKAQLFKLPLKEAKGKWQFPPSKVARMSK